MRRPLTVLMATCLLSVSATQAAMAQSEEPPEDTGSQRVEVPEAGLTVMLPADWSISIPLARRLSELPAGTDAGEPVYETTLVWARGADGRWCDIDRYEGSALSLAEHAAWLQVRLQSPYEVDRFVEVGPAELPVGEAYQVRMDDGVRDRTWTMYLFGPEDDQYLLSCVAELGADEDWLSIAESLELQLPVEAEPA